MTPTPGHEVFGQWHVVREHDELLDEVVAERNLEEVKGPDQDRSAADFYRQAAGRVRGATL